MKSENGWILPDGRYVECAFHGHIKCAEDKLGMNEAELEKIAIKVCCSPNWLEYVVVDGFDYSPEFHTEREVMTKKQLKAIEEYCLHFRFRSPLDYFFQQDLHHMTKLSTKEILAILEKDETP